jgi:hypothetical protein
MKTTLALTLAATILAVHVSASAAPEISSGAQVVISGNKAKNITTSGGKGGFSTMGGLGTSGEASMNGVANVNSLVVNGGKVAGKVVISNNEASDVKALGGTANVNSVVLNK